MAKVGFWGRLFGGDARTIRMSAEDVHFGASLLQQILKLAGQDRAAPGIESRPGPSPVGQAGLDSPLHVSFAIAAAGRDAIAATPFAPSGQGPEGPAGLEAEGGGPTVTVLVDWPWQLAEGLALITADAASMEKMEPRNWLETYLALTASTPALQVGFAADEFGAAGSDSPFLAWAAGQVRDVLGLSGDFSAGFALGAPSFEINRVVISGGNDYDLAANDNFVGAGRILVIDAGALGDGDDFSFDGSGETDGGFNFIGGGGGDFFFGGAGADRIDGGAGGDSLSGGGGGDVFVYRGPGDSSGADYDTIADFDPAADRIDLPATVSGFGAAVTAGALSTATFDSDLATAVRNLGAAQAVWFAPNAGDLAGRIFLVVDGNGKAGYQAGEDFVIAIAGAPLADLTGHTDIFI